MKGKILVFLISFFSLTLLATPESLPEDYKEDHIEIRRWRRYFNPVRDVYYQELTKVLNQFIKEGISNGSIDNRKYYFEIEESKWMDHARGVRISRYKGAAKCELNGLVQKITFEYLAKIIKYYKSPEWRSFFYDEKKLKPETALKIFNKRLSGIKVSVPVIEIIGFSEFGKVYLEEDSLVYKGRGHEITITDFLPVNQKGIDIVSGPKEILVIDFNEDRNSFSLSKIKKEARGAWYSYRESYRDWVNFYDGTVCILTYCISQNKFYNLSLSYKP